MAVINNLVPTTELDAVNTMLAGIGNDALDAGTDLSTVTGADELMAIATLRNTTREVQSRGWRFNSESGVEIEPTAQYNWADNDGATTELNVFKRPSGTLAWKQTVCSENGELDLIERRSKRYTEAAAAVMVLYDRTKNRDGADSGTYSTIFIDAVWAFNFEDMPEEARRYIAVRAARRFAETQGLTDQAEMTRDDETLAYRLLKKSQGLTQDFNILDTVRGAGILGMRPWRDGPLGRRVYPGPN